MGLRNVLDSLRTFASRDSGINESARRELIRQIDEAIRLAKHMEHDLDDAQRELRDR